MNIIDLFGVISGLASVNRFSMVRLSRPENVLEHTGMVVLICYFLHNQIVHELDLKLDLGTLLGKAVSHDIDEIITGDIARPTKYSSEEFRQCLMKLEVQGVLKIAELLNDNSLVLHHATAKHGPEGMIVSIADLFAVVYKIWDEVLMQNNYLMVRQAINVQGYLENTVSKLKKDGSELALFLLGIVSQLQDVARQAAALDRPVHGTIREDIFNDKNNCNEEQRTDRKLINGKYVLSPGDLGYTGFGPYNDAARQPGIYGFDDYDNPSRS